MRNRVTYSYQVAKSVFDEDTLSSRKKACNMYVSTGREKDKKLTVIEIEKQRKK